jgi:two-component system response regulator FlrC
VVDPVATAPDQAITNEASGDFDDDQAQSLGSDLRQREFEVIVRTIRNENGSRKRAAERLGISPRTLRYKIARFRDVGFAIEDCL